MSDGGEVTIALRELLMPFSRMFGLSLVELFPPSDIAPDNAQLSRALAHLLRGEVTLTPTDGGLSAVYYSEGSPELSDVKLEAELDESGLRARLYENTENGYAAVARADLTALDDGLRLRAEDYAHGGFFYLDVNMRAHMKAQWWYPRGADERLAPRGWPRPARRTCVAPRSRRRTAIFRRPHRQRRGRADASSSLSFDHTFNN